MKESLCVFRAVAYFLRRVLVALLFILPLGCVSMAQAHAVYSLLPDEQFSEGIDGGGDMKYGFCLRNDAEKDMKSFRICFSVFDDEGESALYSDYGAIDFERVIKAGDEAHFSIDLGDFFEAKDGILYTIDFVYAESITYSDGTTWEDFFGVYAAKM